MAARAFIPPVHRSPPYTKALGHGDGDRSATARWSDPRMVRTAAATVGVHGAASRLEAPIRRAALDWSTEGRLTVPPVPTEMQDGNPQKPHKRTGTLSSRRLADAAGNGSSAKMLLSAGSFLSYPFSERVLYSAIQTPFRAV